MFRALYIYISFNIFIGYNKTASENYCCCFGSKQTSNFVSNFLDMSFYVLLFYAVVLKLDSIILLKWFSCKNIFFIEKSLYFAFFLKRLAYPSQLIALKSIHLASRRNFWKCFKESWECRWMNGMKGLFPISCWKKRMNSSANVRFLNHSAGLRSRRGNPPFHIKIFHCFRFSQVKVVQAPIICQNHFWKVNNFESKGLFWKKNTHTKING